MEEKIEEGNNEAIPSFASLVERQEKANQEHKALLEREEKLEALRRIGGQTSNVPTQEVKKEESPSEYARRIDGRK